MSKRRSSSSWNDPETPRSRNPGIYPSEDGQYTIRRKGSRYNITGPQGRVFGKYQSAAVAGPRWEELTHTPWPFPSSAYEPGLRLWQMGIITREEVGPTRLLRRPESGLTPNESKKSPPEPTKTRRRQTVRITIIPFAASALPAPRIDLQEHTRLMHALRRDPNLLFDEQVQQALQHEVEYYRPDARWAQTLLNMLARFEVRRRKQQRASKIDSQTILARHIAWQEQQINAAAATS